MIDVTKCIGCRKGTSLFFEKDGEYIHVDLFATPESGSACKCENSETIGNFLMKNGDRGTFIPNEQSREFFNKQVIWWEDIIKLAYDTLKEQEMVSEFFNNGENGDKMWNKTNLEIENALLTIASNNGIEVNEDILPDVKPMDDSKQ